MNRRYVLRLTLTEHCGDEQVDLGMQELIWDDERAFILKRMDTVGEPIWDAINALARDIDRLRASLKED